MKRDQSFHDFVMDDLFKNIVGITSKAMFGGWGIYKNGVIFAIIAEGQLYLKVGDHNRANFEKLGSHPFVYAQGKHKPTTMSYYLLPEEIMESEEKLSEWVESSVQANKQIKKIIMKNSINANKFFPVLITDKLEETKQFYISLLGCSVVFYSDWYIQLVSPKGLEIGLLIAGHSSQPNFLQKAYKGNGMVPSFEVENVDEEYKKIKLSKFAIAYDIKTEAWGQRHFMIRDPNGMVVDVVQQLQQ